MLNLFLSMNLSEAARTGRKFRRVSQPEVWYRIHDQNLIQIGKNPQQSHPVYADVAMITATDWENEPIRMEITAQDLYDAAKVIGQNPVTHQRRFSVGEMAKLLAEQLGLIQGI